MSDDISIQVEQRRPLFDHLTRATGSEIKPDLDHYRRTLMQTPRLTLLRWFSSVTDIPDVYLTELLSREHRLPVLPDTHLVQYKEAVDYFARFVARSNWGTGWIPLLTYGPFLYLAHYDPLEPLPAGLPPLVGQVLLTSAGYEVLQAQWVPVRAQLKPGPVLDPDAIQALVTPPSLINPLAAQTWLRSLGVAHDPLAVRLLVSAQESRMIRFPLKKLDLDYQATPGVSAESLRTMRAFPFYRFGSLLFVAVENPEDAKVEEVLRMKVNCEVIGVPVDSKTIDELWQLLADKERQTNERDHYVSVGEDVAAVATDTAVDADIELLLSKILGKAVSSRASDIHFGPCKNGGSFRVRFRMDGEMYPTDEFSPKVGRQLLSRLKLMAKCNIADNRKPQDGRTQLKVGGKDVDLRVAVCPMEDREDEMKERAVVRILDSTGIPDSLEALNFPVEDLDRLRRCLDMRQGLVLVSGPTGSGKTTTLYAALKRVNAADTSVVTVEDPIEYRLEGVEQHSVNPSMGLTFGIILRSVLRMDPDVVMVGEIRDEETAETALRAANTGHLVLSTVHANDAVACLTRLSDMGSPRYVVAEAGRLFVAQRLVRRVCRACRMPRPLTAGERALLESQGYCADQLPESVYSSRGCPQCFYTGYLKRFAVSETLEMTTKLRETYLREGTRQDVFNVGREQGFKPMYTSALGRVLLGDTTFQETFYLQSLE